MTKFPPSTAPLAACQEPHGQTEFTYKLAYVIIFSSEINAGKHNICSYFESSTNRWVESGGAKFSRVKSDFVILFLSWREKGGDKGTSDLLTFSAILNFLKKIMALFVVPTSKSALNRLQYVTIEQGWPILRQNDPQRLPDYMPVKAAKVMAVFSFRGWSQSLPAISYQTCRITEAAQVLAAIIHPYCIDPVGLVRMQCTFQGNFFSTGLF